MTAEVDPVSSSQGDAQGRPFNQVMRKWMNTVKSTVASLITRVTTLETSLASIPTTKTTLYTTVGAGTHNWDTRAIGAWVTIVAGSGGAAGSNASWSLPKGGVAGGQILKVWVDRLSGALTAALLVGAKGTGGNAANPGTDGGNSSFNGVIAYGSLGGQNTAAGANGPTFPGAVAPVGGTTATPGNPGAPAAAIGDETESGPAGGGAGTSGANTPGGKGGTSRTGQPGGDGGLGSATPAAGGGGGGGGFNGKGGDGGAANTPGSSPAAGVYGAGPGGNGQRTSGTITGADGAQGCVLVQEVLV